MEGRYARLERLDPARHAQALFDAFAGHHWLWDYMPQGPFETAQQYRDWAEAAARGADPFFYAIIDKETDSVTGAASYLRIAPEAGSIEVGNICFSPALQRTRAATEAMALMMGWAFDAGYRRYEWKCNALNRPSRLAAQRLGFSYEGIFRQALVVKGRNRDTAWFACIDKEWPALRAAFETWLDPVNFEASGAQKQSLSNLTAPVLVACDPSLS
ncbi:acetyltransferase [Seohaeicola zhoushanensis]|uniref:Acetyltransferase n=2 Tax=Seohaeicola zhoushanensis TaxID=1569283 RepID=A0A8J3M4Z0_9RHOB|nr:acetyltransferase [Seohaeicola zhoushanensis]